MRRSRFFWAGAVLLSCLPAVASAGNHDSVRAEALFDEGRRLMAAGDYASACPKFADSQALDPAPGTALNLAACYERAGKLASAWEAYKLARSTAETAGQAGRASAAKKKAAELEPKIPRIRLVVPPEARVADLSVRVDGQPTRPSEWEIALPFDGGGHDVEVSAPGKKTWTSHVDLKTSEETLVVTVPLLDDAGAPAQNPPALVTAPGAAPDLPPALPPAANPADADAANGRTRRIVGLVIGGTGIVAIGVGGAIGLVAKSQYDKAQGESGPAQDSDSLTALGTARAANVVLGVGAAVAVAGAIVWLTAPKAHAAVGVAGQEVILRGTF